MVESNPCPTPRAVEQAISAAAHKAQAADNICATFDLYHGAPSSRERDLVDLVVIAPTHSVQA